MATIPNVIGFSLTTRPMAFGSGKAAKVKALVSVWPPNLFFKKTK